MWKGVHPASELSLATTAATFSSLRSWKSFSTKSLPQGSREDGETTIEYVGTIPEDPDALNTDQRLRPFEVTKILLKHFWILILVSIPLIFLGVVSTVPRSPDSLSNRWSSNFNHCNFDGSFTPYAIPTVSLWTGSGFFKISLFWGHVSFSTAKFLDVLWDIIIGRGGQAVLALITYKVSTKALAKAMETAPVSYQTFEAIAYISPSLAKIGNLSYDLLTNRGLQARATMLFLVMSSLFVIAFPTLASSMSGYSNNISPFLQTRNGSSVPWLQVNAIQFTINDGTRIGQTDAIQVNANRACLTQSPHTPGTNMNTGGSNYHPRAVDTNNVDEAFETVPDSCRLFWRTVQYIGKYGLHGTSQTASEFYFNDKEIDLPSPSLNITTTYDARSLDLLTSIFDNLSETDRSALQRVSSVSPNTIWIFNNETFSYDYITMNVSCNPINSHNWGLSFPILFITSLWFAIWTLGIYALWLNAYLHSQIDRRGRSLGVYRASWDLVDAMRNDQHLEEIDKNTDDRAIRKHLRKYCSRRVPLITGGGISYRNLANEENLTRWMEFKYWWFGRQLCIPSSAGISEKSQILTTVRSISPDDDKSSKKSSFAVPTPRTPLSGRMPKWSRALSVASTAGSVFRVGIEPASSISSGAGNGLEGTNYQFRNDLGDG